MRPRRWSGRRSRHCGVRSQNCAQRLRSCVRERVFRQGARWKPAEVSAIIDQERGQFGVELVCRALGVSASAHYHRKTGQRSERVVEDERLTAVIRMVHKDNYECYGQRRMHAALSRRGESVGRDQVARLMRQDGIRGAKRRGKPWRTTTPDPTAQRPSDLLCRDFTAPAPDRTWVGDFTYLRCWEGRVFFSFVIDVLEPPRGRLAARRSHADRPGPRRAADGDRNPGAGGVHAYQSQRRRFAIHVR
jgi:hypothetical protein